MAILDRNRQDSSARVGRTSHQLGQTADDLILRMSLLMAALPGFSIFNSANNSYPVTFFLDAVIVALSLRARRARTGYVSMLLYLPVVYLLTKYALMLLGERADILDFLQAYKAYLFLAVAVSFVGTGCFTGAGLEKTVRLVMMLFAAKYSIDLVVGIRPMVYTENNYELMTLLGLTYLALPYMEARSKNRSLFLLVYIIAISQSRSSALELIICFIAIFFRWQSGKLFRSVVPLSAVLLGAKFVFSERMTVGGWQAVDRVVFWQIFYSEVRAWSPMEWVLGTVPLSPLSSGACARMSWYQGLFSFGNDGVCYSVVLHSYAIRSLFDQGLLGSAFLLCFIAFVLKKSGASSRDVYCILGIGVANALSVSAFNSEYLLIVLVVALGIRRSEDRVAAEGNVKLMR